MVVYELSRRTLSRRTLHTLYMHKLNPDAFVKSRRSVTDFDRISSSIRNRFKPIIDEANKINDYRYTKTYIYSNPIRLGKNIIDNVDKLVVEIASKYLEGDEKTLSIFEKAIRIHNDIAPYFRDHPKIGYQYELDLEKLLPQNLSGDDLKRADAFIERYDSKTFFYFLREVGALKRIYDSPISIYTRETKKQFGWSQSDVKGLTEYWFGEPIRNAQIANVQLNFSEFSKTLTEELAAWINKNKLLEDGQAFRLLKAAISCAAIISCLNKEKPIQFVLDLELLIPRHLKNNNISEKMIDDFIDDPEHFASFLLKAGAFRWTEQKDKKLLNYC